MKRTKVKVKVNAYSLICEALDAAIQSGMNKTDKWCERQLDAHQRSTLAEQINNYFWCNIEEKGVEFE